MINKYRFSAGQFSKSFVELRLTGSDLDEFLQKQSAFNFELIRLQQFHLISFLDPQGRIECYVWALKTISVVMLLVPSKIHEQTLVRLNKFLISEDVEIENRGMKTWFIQVGPLSKESEDSFTGELFAEKAVLSRSKILADEFQISDEDMELWRSLNGWPNFEGTGFESELINNTRFFDLSVTLNKGCYPGQETVSKIATRRGAAYSPVLLETTSEMKPGDLFNFERKIGEVYSAHEWQGKYYLAAKLLRDFRVDKLNLNLVVNGSEFQATVKYYPLLSGSPVEKAEELLYEASEAFKKNDLQKAERYFLNAIKVNPSYADAYEALGVMLGRQDRFIEAIELMDKLTAVDPTSVLAHTNKSLYLMKLGKIEEAEQEKSLATVKSFQKFGEEAKLKERLDAEKKFKESEWAKREGMFRQVLEIDADDTLANYGLGSIAVEKSDWPNAIHHLEKVIQADENYSVAYLALGKALKGSGEAVKAKEIWKKGIEIAAKKGDLMPANQMQMELQSI